MIAYQRTVASEEGKGPLQNEFATGPRVSKNLVEFRRRNGEIKSNKFSGATCACQKTLLSLQMWKLCAPGAQFMRCSRLQTPVSEKALPFSTG